MISTTTSKKGIVDFLWEWAETQGDWAKHLISIIVSTESELSPSDRQTVFNYFLQSIQLHNGLPVLTIVKPTYTPTSKQIELNTLSGVTGVNRLAKNQTVTFSKNLTVIFGENGTGKTGYGRILKTLGFSYDNNNKILSNIFGASDEVKSATIKFKANGIDETFIWNGTNKNDELENISVFNNNCVQISLSDRQLIVLPIGFHLFNIVTSELNELTKLLNVKTVLHPTAIVGIDTLNIGTPQQLFISELSAKSTEAKLTELATITPTQEQELKTLETELEKLNKTLLETQIQNLNASTKELGILIGKIQFAEINFTPEKWLALIELNNQIAELESKTQTGIKEIAESNGIEFYATKQFQLFIKAAEDYIKIINKPQYPESEENCIYCLQPLQTSSKELLSSYRTLLNDTTQENLQSLKKKKTDIINQVLKVETNLTFHQPTFGLDESEQIIQPKEITEYNTSLEVLKSTFTTDKLAKDSTFSFEYSKYSKFLSEKNSAIALDLKDKQDLLLNIATKEAELKKKIEELKDRKLLSGKIVEVKKAIDNHKIVSVLNKNASSFNTSAISRKTTQAREELISINFDTIFKDELKAFRKTNINIDLGFGTERGNSKVTHRINKHLLTDILSEGEQKAIALAEFLTELQLDCTSSNQCELL
jgi:hypothetical protein